jgi:hypothetical protein
MGKIRRQLGAARSAASPVFIYGKSLRLLAEKAGFIVERVIYDSESFQFWASEQYIKNIPLTDERSYHGDIAASIFNRSAAG